jgi:hypothetical protein
MLGQPINIDAASLGVMSGPSKVNSVKIGQRMPDFTNGAEGNESACKDRRLGVESHSKGERGLGGSKGKLG